MVVKEGGESLTVIEDVIAKCEEIESQVTFIRTLAGKASNPKWVENDPEYTHALAVYQNAKVQLEAFVEELP